jgi:hypothetical protein
MLSRCLLGVCLLATPALAQPLSNAFTYQGQLTSSGQPAAGAYDFKFSLFDNASGGTQTGPQLCTDNVTVAGGLFNVQLDFGAQFAGQQRFLEIWVRPHNGQGCGSTAGFTILGPRQSLTAAPNAAFSITAASAALAANASQLDSQPAAFYTNAANLTGTIPSARLSGTYSSTLNLTSTSNTFFGSGAGLTALNASSLASGTIDPARFAVPFTLSGSDSVGIINATNSASNTFTAAVHGVASSATGAVNGLFGEAASPDGNGVVGRANSTTGSSWGVLGQSMSIDGLGGYFTGPGDALWAVTSGTGKSASLGFHTGTADGYGVYGQTNGTTGAGVFGQVYSGTGLTYGGRFHSFSTGGTGAAGIAYASSGLTTGLYGESDSPSGRGVYGTAPATGGACYGGYFTTASSSGVGLFASNTATTGFCYAMRVDHASPSGAALYSRASSTTGFAFGGEFDNYTPNGNAVNAFNAATTGTSAAVQGNSNSPDGVALSGNAQQSGPGTGKGVVGASSVNNGIGVYGIAGSFTGANIGGYFVSQSTSGIGLYGKVQATSGGTIGTRGEVNSTGGTGVVGVCTANTGTNYGVTGNVVAANGSAAVAGSTIAGSYGGYFENGASNGIAVYGVAYASGASNYGVLGNALNSGSTGWGLYAFGRSGASGTKSFRIDHPADPQNKYLLHYSAEGPDPLNVYTGKVTLNEQGEATVDLPAYFAAINKDPRYTLTAVGAAMPLLHVSDEIDEGLLTDGAAAAPGQPVPHVSFRIAGGAPNAKVSWRIEALRNDRWIRQYGAPVEADKPDSERGTYQHPELFNQPQNRATRPAAHQTALDAFLTTPQRDDAPPSVMPVPAQP